MYQLIATVLVILTVLACVSKPQLHKNVFIYDSNYTVVETEESPQELKNLPTMVVAQDTETFKTPKTEHKVTVQETSSKVKPQKTEKSVVKNQPQTTKQETVAVQQQAVKTAETDNPLLSILSKKETTPKTEVSEVKTETKQEPAKVVQTNTEPKQTQTVSQTEKERQELILWNVWRSNLQNRIMQDTKLPIIPEGVIFRFKFDVDKYGKISNVQTWSMTPAYTPYAIQYIAPVIRSYQGREILNFPEGSNRVSTTVEGGWKISKTAKYSTPADYKDSEKVISK